MRRLFRFALNNNTRDIALFCRERSLALHVDMVMRQLAGFSIPFARCNDNVIVIIVFDPRYR